jgi:hypothetical protein
MGKNYVVVTIDNTESHLLKLAGKNNPTEAISYDFKKNTSTYKIFCESLEEAFELGVKFQKLRSEREKAHAKHF